MTMAGTKIQDAVSDDDLKYETWASIVKVTLAEVGLWDVVENGVHTTQHTGLGPGDAG